MIFDIFALRIKKSFYLFVSRSKNRVYFCNKLLTVHHALSTSFCMLGRELSEALKSIFDFKKVENSCSGTTVSKKISWYSSSFRIHRHLYFSLRHFQISIIDLTYRWNKQNKHYQHLGIFNWGFEQD